jgi:hypothetical protein
VLVPVEEEFNLAYHDVALIDELKIRLASEGKFPVARMLEALAITGLVRWPQALEGAADRRRDESAPCEISTQPGRFVLEAALATIAATRVPC